MHQWQNLLQQGNDCFHSRDLLTAEYCYKTAYELLDDLWLEPHEEDELLFAWICTSHNLSSLYERQKDYAVSLQYLMLSHIRVQTIINNPETSSQLFLIAEKALKITMTSLTSFAKKYPICQSCREQIGFLYSAATHENTTFH